MNIVKKNHRENAITLSNGKKVIQPPSYTIPILFLLLLAIGISVKITGFDFVVLLKRGEQFFVILIQMIPPDFSYLSNIWGPLFDTMKMSILGSVIGAVVAIPFSVAASSNIIKNPVLISLIRLFLSIIRTLPTLVSALIATYVFGLGTFAGTTAIAVFTFAYVGKLLYEQIETVDMGSYEALEALGATKFHSFLYAVVPSILPGYLSNCLFCFEGNVRYASILGYVGAGGLGMILNEKIGWREYNKVGMILLALFLTVILIEYISYRIREKLV